MSEVKSKQYNFNSVTIVVRLVLNEDFLLAINDPEWEKTGGYCGLLWSTSTIEARITRSKSTPCTVSVTVVNVHDLCPSV